MGTKSREVIFGSRIAGAKIRAEGARKRAIEAVRAADRAEAEAWSIPHGGLRRPSAAVADDRTMPQRRLRLAPGQMPALPDRGQHSARSCPPTAGHTDLEVGGGAEMPIMPDPAILATGAHDPAHRGAADRALRLGSPSRRPLNLVQSPAFR
jgi:hypothetical protein